VDGKKPPQQLVSAADIRDGWEDGMQLHLVFEPFESLKFSREGVGRHSKTPFRCETTSFRRGRTRSTSPSGSIWWNEAIGMIIERLGRMKIPRAYLIRYEDLFISTCWYAANRREYDESHEHPKTARSMGALASFRRRSCLLTLTQLCEETHHSLQLGRDRLRRRRLLA
jgi:hypothetical protein